MSWELEDYTSYLVIGVFLGLCYSLGDCTFWLLKVALENLLCDGDGERERERVTHRKLFVNG